MKAVILAAGTSSRMAAITQGQPKCSLRLHGKPLLHHQLDILAACGITDITVVTGFGAELVRAIAAGRSSFYHYPAFATTNNLHTLYYSRHLLSDEALVLFADVLVPRYSLNKLIHSEGDFALLVDTTRCVEGTMRVRLREGSVVDLGPQISVAEGHGSFIGLARYSMTGAQLLAAELEAMVAEGDHHQDYYTAALPRLAGRGHRLKAVLSNGSPWIELDTPEDYLAARNADFYLF